MCLDTVTLNLTEWRNGEYIGVGYKLMPKQKLGSWRKAKVDTNRINHRPIKNDALTADMSGDEYYVGFHIFVRKEDAAGYWDAKTIKDDKLHLYRVEYKNVTAFGRNSFWTDDNTTLYAHKTGLCGDCVIAQNIRYVEELS